jgi:hypothetical protein
MAVAEEAVVQLYVQDYCWYGKSSRGVASANAAMASCESRVRAACESAEMWTVVQYEVCFIQYERDKLLIGVLLCVFLCVLLWVLLYVPTAASFVSAPRGKRLEILFLLATIPTSALCRIHKIVQFLTPLHHDILLL